MGIDIGKATKALIATDNDLTAATSLCCESGDTIITDDLDKKELSIRLASILKAFFWFVVFQRTDRGLSCFTSAKI